MPLLKGGHSDDNDCWAATVLTRFLPFIIFGGGRPIPDFVNYLGKVLPFAVTGMLVVYSLKDAPFNAWHGLPEFICAAITLALHFWRRSMLISIVKCQCLNFMNYIRIRHDKILWLDVWQPQDFLLPKGMAEQKK